MKVKGILSVLRGVTTFFFFWFTMFLMLLEVIFRPLAILLYKMKILPKKYSEIYKVLLHLSAGGILDISGVNSVVIKPVQSFFHQGQL